MPAKIQGARLKNTAAAAFFARKLNLPSNEWSDLWREAHDKAFTVAGTLNDSGEKALAQIREAVRAAIEDGETIEEFKKRFDDIVAKTGWDYRGGRNFRARAIFETNLRTSWAAGRFAQMDEIKSERPFWQYRHGGSAVPRPEHLAWDGLILHADHPWWRTHYPPNGFGCTCHVVCLSAREVDREWKKAGGKGNPPKLDAHSPGIVLARGQKGEKSKPRLWTPPDPEKDLVEVKVKGRGLVQVPRGIDPGWDYVPGKAALEAAKAQKAAQKAPSKAASRAVSGAAEAKVTDAAAIEADRKRREALAEIEAEFRATVDEIERLYSAAVERIKSTEDAAPEDIQEALERLAKAREDLLDQARAADAEARRQLERLEFADPGVPVYLTPFLAVQQTISGTFDSVYVVGRLRVIRRPPRNPSDYVVEGVEVGLTAAAPGAAVKAEQLVAQAKQRPRLSRAHVFEEFDKRADWRQRKITGNTPQAFLDAFWENIENGQMSIFTGSDNREYIETIVASRRLLVRAEDWKDRRTNRIDPSKVHWYPVGGDAALVLDNTELKTLKLLKDERERRPSGQKDLSAAEIRALASSFFPDPVTEARIVNKMLAIQRLLSDVTKLNLKSKP